MPIPTIVWEEGKVKLIDQTHLPKEFIYICCENVSSLLEAVKSLKVRGAPAIGIAAALGVVLGIKDSAATTYSEFEIELNQVINQLEAARPTARNLFWSLERMRKVARENAHRDISVLKRVLLEEALKILEEDRFACREIAKWGASLLQDHDAVLTHCNAGSLATADYGTALGLIYKAREDGKRIKVYVDETRPLLQGARLTAWELLREGIDTTLICDSMAAVLMKEAKVDKVIVGADRIVRNGDTANKIGTYNLAVLAKVHKISLYVVAPSSSFDLTLASGDQIPIEQRDGREVKEIFGTQIAPSEVKVFNPAFDVTPAHLISAIVTEKGILRPPYEESIAKILQSA